MAKVTDTQYGPAKGGDTRPVMAKDVQVAKIFQARCSRAGCDWSGELLDDFQAANADRNAHLGEHRELLSHRLAEACADPRDS